MTQIGETVAVGVIVDEKKKKGSLKITVIDNCDGDPIKDAVVTINKKPINTDASGQISLNDIPAINYAFTINKHFSEADYIQFVIHYPKASISHTAESNKTGAIEVEDGKIAEQKIKLTRYRAIVKITFERKHINVAGEDKYGHWWSVIDDIESYGWWPKYPIGHPKNSNGSAPIQPTPPADEENIVENIQFYADKAAYATQKAMYDIQNHSLIRTMGGVEGELNGQTSFGGTATMDPHHISGDEGDDRFQPVVNDCIKDSAYKQKIRNFKDTYQTEVTTWNWLFETGKHCHSFQIEMIKHCSFIRFKEL